MGPPELSSPTHKGGIGKRVQKKRPESMVGKGFPAPTPLARQPLFETSEKSFAILRAIKLLRSELKE